MLPNVLVALENLWDLEMPRHRRRNADISVYRDFVARHDICVPEEGKSIEAAVRYREEGNCAYQQKRLDDALSLYNRSICYAENQSEHLGIGYANRSAIYFEMQEYEFALYNIDLAKKHKYPERLMPKLLSREAKCKERFAGGHSKGTVPDKSVDINVEVNPKIPYLAKGIGMKQYEGMGRGLVAERDFNTGDVILDEQIDLSFVSHGRNFNCCCHCGSVFLKSLIPCDFCVGVMYCGKECRVEDLRVSHRFECAVVTKLFGVDHGCTTIMARLFFYGLTAFKDNINKMMEYCLLNAAVNSNPLDLDLTKPNPLGVFKMLFQAISHPNPDIEHHIKFSATAIYHVLMKNPLVQSILRTDAQRNFMLRCLMIHGRLVTSLVINRRDKHGCLAVLSPVASLINHSCDPNAVSEIESGRIKVIVIRPIRSGEQILSSYAPAWWDSVNLGQLNFQCACVVCDRGPDGAKWHKEFKKERIISFRATREMCEGGAFASSDLVKYQRMVQIHANDGLHPGKLFGEMLNLYIHTLRQAVRKENAKINRARVLERLN